jgi:hypothetical protein
VGLADRPVAGASDNCDASVSTASVYITQVTSDEVENSKGDASGNVTTATPKVTVPKSQNGNPAVDDGPHYVVSSGCP